MTIEQISKKVFPGQRGLTVTASNKVMLKRSAFIKGYNYYLKNNHMTPEQKYNISAIQLMLNKHSSEILKIVEIPILEKDKLITHNSFIITELEKLKNT